MVWPWTHWLYKEVVTRGGFRWLGGSLQQN